MVAHLVLFRPKDGLDEEARRRFTDALSAARRDIPAVRRFSVGRRLAGGPSYDLPALPDFPYVAVVEFDDEEGLRAYLAHPAHEALGLQFRSALAAALVYDFEMVDAGEAATLLGGAGASSSEF